VPTEKTLYTVGGGAREKRKTTGGRDGYKRGIQRKKPLTMPFLKGTRCNRKKATAKQEKARLRGSYAKKLILPKKKKKRVLLRQSVSAAEKRDLQSGAGESPLRRTSCEKKKKGFEGHNQAGEKGRDQHKKVHVAGGGEKGKNLSKQKGGKRDKMKGIGT